MCIPNEGLGFENQIATIGILQSYQDLAIFPNNNTCHLMCNKHQIPTNTPLFTKEATLNLIPTNSVVIQESISVYLH